MTTAYIILATLTAVVLYLGTGLAFILLVDYTDAPLWVERASVLMLEPWHYKEWKEIYQEELERA